MSSLQKFHRRTQSLGPKLPPTIGSESLVSGAGFYLGKAGDGTSYMYVAPKSTEVQQIFGSYGIARGNTSTSDGPTNTNTLYAFGSTAHPAAYYAKTLTTGGYNTWYLPATTEMITLYSNKSATPFSTTNGFIGGYHWSSTENNANDVWVTNYSNGGQFGHIGGYNAKTRNYYIRAVRRI